MDQINLENIFVVSDDVVAREIEGELIIVPLAAGIGDMGDELYTLNETGKAIWRQLDGSNNLGKIVTDMVHEFAAERAEIEQDVLGLVAELARRRIVVQVETL